MKYETVEDAIDIANGGKYGLGASVFGPDQEACLQVAKRLECGMVSVNDFGVFYVSASYILLVCVSHSFKSIAEVRHLPKISFSRVLTSHIIAKICHLVASKAVDMVDSVSNIYCGITT